MHPNLSEVVALLDRSRAAVRAALERVLEHDRGRRPGEGRWSVNEVVEHLALVDARFDGVVGTAIADARRAGLGREQKPRIPLSDAVQGRLADRSVRGDAPESTVPTGTLHGSVAVESWERAHEAFRATVTAADGLALGDIVSEHRRWGPLTVYQWMEVCAAHETRHAAQIDEIAAQIGARQGA